MSSPPSILESTLKSRAGRYLNSDFDVGLRWLVDGGFFILIESERERRYQVPLDVNILSQVQDFANGNPAITGTNQSEIVQKYSPDPPGYRYWWSPPDDPNRSRKKSVYLYYKGEKDENDYVVIIRSMSGAEPDPYRLGSMHDPESWIAKGWKIFNELVKKNENGTVSLIQLLTRDASVFEAGTKRRGKVMLAIWEKEGWIVRAEKNGNEMLYRLSGSHPPEAKRNDMDITEFFKPAKASRDADFEADTGLDQSEPKAESKKKERESGGDYRK